ncbi:MAG: Tol-Pal system beta propeller repeat protein TolB [Pseudomonadota bacterium]
MIPFHRLSGFLLTVLISLTFAAGAKAELQVDITRGHLQPLPIAISDFYGKGPSEQQVGRDIAGVISADLERSGLFKPVDKRAFLQDAASLQVQPRFADWRVVNAQALVNGAITVQPDGRLKVEFRLWDVFAETQMSGLQYRTQRENWRRVAHIIADAIYKRITGEEGYFDTRIVYVAESGPANQRVKRLAIMDQDGENHRYLTDGRSLVLTPRFSRTTQEITYLSYYNNTPRVYLFNIETGRQEVLGTFSGMTFAPRFAPNGNSVIMSFAENGNSDIYTMDLRTRKSKRLTSHPAIDTSPSYSPDGKRIVFNSDRGGSPQLYVMNADGSNVHRISFGQGRYATHAFRAPAGSEHRRIQEMDTRPPPLATAPAEAGLVQGSSARGRRVFSAMLRWATSRSGRDCTPGRAQRSFRTPVGAMLWRAMGADARGGNWEFCSWVRGGGAASALCVLAYVWRRWL